MARPRHRQSRCSLRRHYTATSTSPAMSCIKPYWSPTTYKTKYDQRVTSAPPIKALNHSDKPHDGTVQQSGRPDVRHVSTLPSMTGLCRGYRLLCCQLLHQGRTRRGESEPGSCNLRTSEPTAPPRSRPPIGLGRTNRVPPRPRLPVGPRANWPCSASPEAGLVPQPRRLRLKSHSGRLSHPINAPSCPHYVSHDRQYATTGATGQRSNRLFTIPY